MRRSTLLTCALLMIATSGCKQITEQVQKIKAKIAAARQRAKPVWPQGAMTLLYYPNGGEYTCGTADVVFLQNGQVVDAVLRWPGHGYSGQSSSPAATPPHGPVRPGGDTLTVKTPSTP